MRVSTRSTAARAVVTCALAPGLDPLEARRAIAERLEAVELPAGVMPRLEATAPASAPERVFTVALDARGEPPELTRARLEAIAGVAEVELCGVRARAVRVELDPDRMAAHGLALSDVLAALRQNEDVPFGRLELGAGEVPVRAGGSSSLADLGARLVRVDAGVSVRLSDVARLEDGREPRTCVAWRSGEGETIVGHVRLSDPGAVERVDVALRELGSARPFGDGARVTRGVVLLSPAASREERWRLVDAVGRSLSGVRGVREVVLDEGELLAPRSLRASIAWESAPSSEAARAAVASIPGAVLVPDDALRLRIVGPDRVELRDLARRACEMLGPESGVRACVVLASEAPELEVELDRDRLAQLGVSHAHVMDTIAAASDDGLAAASWREGAESFDVRVHLRGAQGDAELPRVMVTARSGRVPLSELASVTRASAPSALETIDGAPAITIAISVDPTSVDDIGDALQARLAPPPSVRIEPIP